MQTIRVQTTQNVFIEYRPASIGDRILATLLDWAIMVAYVFTSYKIIAVYVATTESFFELNYVQYLVIFLPVYFYHLLCEIFLNGQSIGKRAMNIKVIKLDGTQPSIGNYLLRWLIRPIDITAFMGAAAIITISSNNRGQRLGDLAAGTSVVSTHRRERSLDTILPEVADENYTPVYPQAVNLSDRDMAIIREALNAYHQEMNRTPGCCTI